MDGGKEGGISKAITKNCELYTIFGTKKKRHTANYFNRVGENSSLQIITAVK